MLINEAYKVMQSGALLRPSDIDVVLCVPWPFEPCALGYPFSSTPVRIFPLL